MRRGACCSSGAAIRRFKAIEAGLEASGRTLEGASLDEMEALWTEAKLAERKS